MGKANFRFIVDDVDEAIDFYTKLLGFRVHMHPAPGFAALENQEFRILLNQPGAGGAGSEMPDGKLPEPGGWNRIQITVNDLDAFHTDLKKKGAAFRNEIVEGKGGRQVLLQDPSGNLIELFEPAGERSVQPIPEGYHTVTPFLLTNNATDLIEFIKKAFDGEIDYMMKSDDGKVRHSTVRIGDSLVMISDGTDQYESRPGMLHLYVEDVDAVYEQAIRAGATSLREPADQFYGDRSAGVEDDWGNQWWLATHIEDVSDKEMKKREKEYREKQETDFKG